VFGPSAAAALAYMNAAGATNDLCAISSKAFLEAIFSGKSVDEANGIAATSYQQAYSRGLRLVPGTACAVSDSAFRSSAGQGKDGILDSAFAFIKSWPGKEGNPCAISGQAFVKAVASGKSTDDADVEAAEAYIDALHQNPNALEKNPACARASEAYIEAYNAPTPAAASVAKAAPLIQTRTSIRNSAPTNNAFVFGPSAAAALAYMNAVEAKDLCAISSKAYLEAIFSGQSTDEANDIAAISYQEAFNRGLRLPLGTACARSEGAFRRSVGQGKDGVLESALAFINSWPGVLEGNPCALSGQAFVRAVASGKSTSEADVEAAEAYLDAINANPDALEDNPACATAADAYIKAYNS